MKILIFGGTSLKSAYDIRQVVNRMHNEPPIGVVVSAIGGATDFILRMVESAENGDNFNKDLNSLFQQFLNISAKLNIKDSYYLKFVDSIQLEAQNNLGEIKRGKCSFKKFKDSVLSIGERLTAFLVNQACLKHNINVSFLDAREVIVTYDNFGNAYVYYDTIYNNSQW